MAVILYAQKNSKFEGLCNSSKRKRNTLRGFLKINPIYLKNYYSGVLGSLITVHHLDLKNSKWFNFYKPQPPCWIHHFEFFKSEWKWKCIRKYVFAQKKAKFAGLCNWSKRNRNTLRRSLKINQIYLKIITQGFLESLITDLHSDLNQFKMANPR